MKGNKNVLLLVVLIVLLGGYLLVKFTNNEGRSKSYRETLVDFNIAAVTKVVIKSSEGETTLSKSDGAWQVNGDKRATTLSVQSMLESLQGVTPSRLASRSSDSWADFQVDSAGTRVTVYEGASEALDLIIGRFGVEGQRSFYTYVRLEEDEDVYVANDFMGMTVGKTDADYRNNTILKLKKDSISSIDFKYPDGTYSLSKSAGDWVMAGVAADSASVAKYLTGLANVSSRNFEDGDHNEAEREVVIHLNGADDVIVKSFGASILNSSVSEEVFNDQTAYDKIFKSPEYFMGQ